MAEHRTNLDIIERRALLLGKYLFQKIRPGSHQQCLFIAGMQRSGTNMLMDVLERSMHTTLFHEDNPRAFHNYEQREHSVLYKLIEESRAPVTVFKALLESDMLPQLLEDFVPAKAIWAVRDYRDVVNSAKRSFPHLQRTIQRIIDEPGDYWQSRGVSPAIHETLKLHYHRELSLNSSVALFWYARNRLYFDKEMHNNKQILLIRYEELVANPQARFREVFDFIDVPFNSWAIQKVHAKSISRHPVPEIEPEIIELCETLYQRF